VAGNACADDAPPPLPSSLDRGPCAGRLPGLAAGTGGRLITAAVRELGQVDVLVNNAAYQRPPAASA